MSRNRSTSPILSPEDSRQPDGLYARGTLFRINDLLNIPLYLK
jgi:hypothetical protein